MVYNWQQRLTEVDERIDAAAAGSSNDDSRSWRHALRGWHSWLPGPQQVLNALYLKLDMDEAPDVSQFDNPYATPRAATLATSMRQGIGLIVVMALVAGLLALLVNWATASRYGVVLPLATLTRALEANATPDTLNYATAEALRDLNALEEGVATGWATFFSALGNWIEWPLNWLMIWLGFGALVLLVVNLLGAGTRLQPFYAATSYAAVPLILLILWPIPVIGAFAAAIAVLWSGAVYTQATKLVTGLDGKRALVAVLLPVGLVIVLAGIFVASLLSSLLGLLL